MRFFKSIFSTFTIWVLASLLNALLGATWLRLFLTEYNHWPVRFALTLLFTIFFSTPGMFVFWLMLLINWENTRLFRSLLKAVFIISILSALFLFLLNDHELERQQLFLSLFNVISPKASIMMHVPIFKTIPSNKITSDYASVNS